MANEKRLIDADALRQKWTSERDFMLNKWGGYGALLNREKGRVDELGACIADVEAAPTVDAVEVVHGRWLGTHDGWFYSYSCSVCGAEALTKEETMHDQVCSAYCPNCGADMRERREGE